jgi:[ribosomal protein S18]-alanine N-acetyltransferase
MSAARDELVGQLQLRDLTFSDISAVMEIENASFTTPWRETTFRGLILRRDTDLLAATRDGRLVGYAVCWTVADQAELGNVAVADSERGRGTGRRLVIAALDRARRRGAGECFLEVRISNESARRLYEACGFQVVGRRRDYYSKPVEDAFVMRRELI